MNKKSILPLALGACMALQSGAQVAVTSQNVQRADGQLSVELTLKLADIKVSSNRAAVVTPCLVAEGDTLRMPAVGLLGRNRYIQHERGHLTGVPATATVMKASAAPAAYAYSASVPFDGSMNGLEVIVLLERYGCAGCGDGAPVAQTVTTIEEAPVLPDMTDMLVYAQPVGHGEKTRTLSGRANVEFPVNRTELREDFRGNYPELARIRAGIDSVRFDKDVTIRRVHIKGFASPEGSYANNVRLAKGRTEALAAYVQQLYAMPDSVMSTAYEPEDWEGLREWVEASNIANREGILAIIGDTSLQPDPRDRKIKTTYPREYATLLNMVYPSLRHSDYTIRYTVRTYTDPAEILRVMKTRPQNLDLNEFYLAASALEPGTPEYNEVFETAVRIHPDDPAANLNAANNALGAGDTARAAAYLAKAGDSPEAAYARGACALMNDDLDTAEPLLRTALAAGIDKAQRLLDYTDRGRRYRAKYGTSK